MTEELLEYFNGDELAASVWQGKYAIQGEKTPNDMHKRMAKEFARIESLYKYELSPKIYNELSNMGKELAKCLSEDEIYAYFEKFKYIVPQGSIMSMLGNKYAVGSLSNCFVIPPPYDSYGGILKTDQHLVQLMKRRGGVGTHISTLRPENTIVNNAAGTSTGTVSFANRYSNTTREVAQNGRRGAFMLLMHVQHPEIFKFVGSKKDRTKITGANISVMLTDKFMQAVEDNQDFLCHFPIDNIPDFLTTTSTYEPVGTITSVFNPTLALDEYNKLYKIKFDQGTFQVMKIHAKELFDFIIEMAWENAEPGIAFIDTIKSYCPEGVYPQYIPIAANPCGEQWLEAYNSCRLLAINIFSIVEKAFTNASKINYDTLYKICYVQQRLGDDVVELEIEYIDKIINKIKADPEPKDVKATELELWENIKKAAISSRRTGCGFTALGDMLAALNLKYDSDEAISTINEVMKTKLKAELDCTIDLAIIRGPFEGYDANMEWDIAGDNMNGYVIIEGKNEFYNMVLKEFPEQAYKMCKFSRRNINWSTVSPTGTVSIMTQSTSGLEPLFLPYYMRRKKVNPSDKGVRVDFVDQSGDSWTEYPVLHPKFKDWIIYNIEFIGVELGWARPLKDIVGGDLTELPYTIHNSEIDYWSKETLKSVFEISPYYKSCANDISWEKRIEIQAVIQKYTTNAISSTINLPENISKEVVANIYKTAWKKGLKGVTVYRDNCRTGVLVAETKPKAETNKFGYADAPKRPKELKGELHNVTIKGENYAVVVGLLDGNPYEIFAFRNGLNFKKGPGIVAKQKKGTYHFIPDDEQEKGVANLQDAALHADEQVLTRLVSGMLRHGMNPHFIIDQINKTPLDIVSFGKAVTRVLKQYIRDEELKGKIKCPECGGTNIVKEEGCSTCKDCGYSACS